MFYVYLLRSKSKKDQFYVGYTINLKKRFAEHNALRSKATKPYAPWEIIFYEAYKSMSDAKRRKLYLKTTKGKKALKIMLKNSMNI
ncbi:MAG: GIY-YIG nuclease family protein [Patescibacteria group bacterium]